MGSTKQLGQGDDEDDVYEPKPITGKQLEKRYSDVLNMALYFMKFQINLECDCFMSQTIARSFFLRLKLAGTVPLM